MEGGIRIIVAQSATLSVGNCLSYAGRGYSQGFRMEQWLASHMQPMRKEARDDFVTSYMRPAPRAVSGCTPNIDIKDLHQRLQDCGPISSLLERG